MNLFIDYREYRLVQHFRDRSNVVIKTLDVGDLAFYVEEDLIALVERKTMNDLAASIMDGRHREQKMRLMNSDIPISKIIYLLEGNVNHIYNKKINTKTILGSIVNTLIRDNLKVYRTDNIEDSIRWIERIYDKLYKNPHCFRKASSSFIDICVSYTNTIKKKKKDNLTPEVCSMIQLSQIPGISTNMAKTILDRYGSIYNLCKKYQVLETTENGKELCEHLLKDIKVPISNSKTRKIGLKGSSKMYHYLCNV